MTSENNALFIVQAKYIIPVENKGLVLENHAVVIEKGKIIDLCTAERAKQKFPDSPVTELKEHALIPGLVNAHGHSAMTLFRGIANDLPLMEWLNDHIWPAEGKWISEQFVEDGTRLAIAEMLKSGTTTFSDMYFFPNIAAQTAKKEGMRAQFVCPLLDFPTPWGSGPEEYLEKALNLAVEYSEDDLITIGLGPHAPYTVSDEPLRNVVELVKDHAIPVQIHLHETQFEVDEAVSNTGKRPIARLNELGLISPEIPLQCVHMTALNDEDIQTLTQSSASVIHCPESNLKLASGFCETQKLLDQGINVALGTDGAASNNDLDILGEMRTAALIAKPVANNAAAVDAPTALEMATLSGAKALGVEDEIGSITVGKAADLTAIDLNRLNSVPSYDPIADIVYSATAAQVSHVWVAGQPKLENHKLTSLDEEALINLAKEWRDKIQQSNEDV